MDAEIVRNKTCQFFFVSKYRKRNVESKTCDPLFELSTPIKVEEPSLDVYEIEDVLVKDEKVFVEEFSPVSFENEEEDPLMVSNTDEISTDGQGLKNVCSSLGLNEIHCGEKPYSCKICGKAFSQSSSLKAHCRIQNCGKEVFPSNEDDDKAFIDKYSPEKHNECNLCDESFIKPTSMEKHNRMHTGEKPHECDTCGKRFSQISNLWTHIKMHTGNRSHICNICGKGFAMSSKLKAHNRIHSGEKPYKCNICGKAFAGLSNLKSHYVTHLKEQNTIHKMGQRIIKCNICGQIFSRSSKLMFHSMAHFN